MDVAESHILPSFPPTVPVAFALSRMRWKGRQVVEFNGTTGSLWWDMEDLNRLHVFYSADEGDGTGGFRDILVSQPDHPFMNLWWPPGNTIGWEHSFVHEWRDFLGAIIDERPISPEQATFEDGYEAALVCDAIAASSNEGRRVRIDELIAGAGKSSKRDPRRGGISRARLHGRGAER